jgi:two-component system sensor histidine kinase AgrC
LTFIGSILTILSTLLAFLYFKTNNKYLTVYEKYNISLSSIREFEQMLERYRINSHENRNQLKTIRCMSKNQKIVSYIDSLLDEEINDDNQLLMDTQSIPAGGLRGIIYTKLLTMKQNDIPFELVVDKKVTTDRVEKIDDSTLTSVCQILGVFLDNSIEEVSKLKEQYILVELYEDEEELAISITNNYEGCVDFEIINNEGVTTKGKNHGYGLSLVKELVKKNKKLTHESEVMDDNFIQKIKIKV